jgi:hypothetical protein
MPQVNVGHPRSAPGGQPVGSLRARLLAFALLGAAGCHAEQKCAELGRCGGDFLGPTGAKEWVATAEDACTDDLQLPVNPVSISQQPPRTAGKKGATQATVDWCSNLVFEPDGSVRYQPWFPIVPVKSATLKFDGKKYDAHFTTYGTQQVAFSAACRAAQGVPESCPLLGRRLDESIRAEANVRHLRCADDGEGGCLCDYELSLFTSMPGTWGAADGIVTFYDTSNAPSPPAPADYCVRGDRLELTGHNLQQLFNRPNLRTLRFEPVSCTDGVQDQGERGIDCEGPCDASCPTCDDGVQSGTERGVDCGGDCRDLCECFNGVQDPFEDDVDCGGPCALDCGCTNGVHDVATEEAVDCGGDCIERYGQGAGEPVPCPQ